MPASSEVDIWSRVIGPSWQGLPADTARAVLRLKFNKADQTRIRKLSDRGQDGGLSSKELNELHQYVHVGRVLALMHSQARRSLSSAATSRRKAS